LSISWEIQISKTLKKYELICTGVRQSQTDTAAQWASALFYSTIAGRSCDQSFDES
jgi:hypothetical protein